MTRDVLELAFVPRRTSLSYAYVDVYTLLHCSPGTYGIHVFFESSIFLDQGELWAQRFSLPD
jgi:hypothetical protein